MAHEGLSMLDWGVIASLNDKPKNFDTLVDDVDSPTSETKRVVRSSLNNLRRIGFVTSEGFLWRLTPSGERLLVPGDTFSIKGERL